MIDIQITPSNFEYDIQSLVQAFYPGHSFKINSNVETAFRRVIIKFEEGELSVTLMNPSDILNKQILPWNFVDFGTSRREQKNILKNCLYKIFSNDTGIELPWGNLTGIRPVKIVGMLSEQGMNETQIREEMKTTYLVSDEKLDLAIEISKREKALLSGMNYREGYSLYIGIPFCPTTCLYCSFTSFPISLYKKKVDAYVDALIKEIKFLGEKLRGRELNTVYIGGGTPTTLEPEQLYKLITALKDNFDFTTVKEFTVEAGRPDSITREKLEVLQKQKVSRISINPQTMHQKTLDLIGRKHTVEQLKQAFYLARECGFDNINMDFIVGLPGETEDMVRYSMEETRKLNPDGITIHSLALKRAARLNREKDDYQKMYMKNDSHLMKITEEYAEKMGMKPYYLYRQKNMSGNQENVGYSIEGCEGLYNILMMGDFQDVFAVGAGAVTKLLSEDRRQGKRIDTVKNVDQYIGRIDEMIDRKRKIFQ